MRKSTALKPVAAEVPATQPAGANILVMVERIMTDPSVSIERVNQAFEFYQRIQADTARKAFDNAMAEAKAKIPPIVKSRRVKYDGKSGGRTSYSHEDLAGIAKVIDPILSEVGLSYRFRTTSEIGQPIKVTCIVAHRLGHSEENTLMAGADSSGTKNSIQAIGSTITYLQRYSLKAALGLSAAHDDDGEKADLAAADLISAEQLAELQGLIKATHTDALKFLEFAKVDALTDLTARQFENAKQALQAKLRKVERK